MHGDPIYSIIIPSFNRRAELERLLAALADQQIPAASYEIIVVDDGSTDQTREYLAGLSDNTRWLAHERQGPGQARNSGAAEARGSILLFIDTDCVPEPGWLAALSAPFSDESVGATGGAEVMQPGDSKLEQVISHVMFSKLSTGGLRGGSGKRLAKYYPRTFNMAVRKSIFDKLGGFKPMYNGEDVEFSYRVRQADYELEYCDEARVAHIRTYSVTDFIRRIFIMGRTRVTLYRLHRPLLEPLHLMPALALALLVLMITGLVLWPGIWPLPALGSLAGAAYAIMLGLSGYGTLGNPLALFMVPLLTALQIMSYGVGFWIGLFDPHPRKDD